MSGNWHLPVSPPHVPSIVLSALHKSFIPYLLCTYFVPGPVPGTGDIVMSKIALVELILFFLCVCVLCVRVKKRVSELK